MYEEKKEKKIYGGVLMKLRETNSIIIGNFGLQLRYVKKDDYKLLSGLKCLNTDLDSRNWV